VLAVVADSPPVCSEQLLDCCHLVCRQLLLKQLEEGLRIRWQHGLLLLLLLLL
jgi:hypothetical protein